MELKQSLFIRRLSDACVLQRQAQSPVDDKKKYKPPALIGARSETRQTKKEKQTDTNNHGNKQIHQECTRKLQQSCFCNRVQCVVQKPVKWRRDVITNFSYNRRKGVQGETRQLQSNNIVSGSKKLDVALCLFACRGAAQKSGVYQTGQTCPSVEPSHRGDKSQNSNCLTWTRH